MRPAGATTVLLLLAGAAGAPTCVLAQAAKQNRVEVQAGPLSHSLLGTVGGTLPNLGANGYDVAARVEGESSTLLGVSAGLRLKPSLTLRARVARTTTALRLVVDATPVGGAGAQRYTFDGLGDVGIWLMDVDLAWAFWRSDGLLVPYVFGGIGASRWTLSGLEDLGALPPLLESPLSLSPITAFLPGAVAGVGVEIAVLGPVRLGIEVADHVSGDPISDDDFRIGTNFVGFGRAKDLVHNFSMTAAARIAFGTAGSERRSSPGPT
ncbi:MAG: hypothetical protein PVJ02_00195 [Gemmatimonadota bacterium]|jgi:hypothetical protein